MAKISEELCELIESGEVIVMGEGGEFCPCCATKRLSEVRACLRCGRPYIPNRGKGLSGRGRPRLLCYECSPALPDAA
jgi:hypothetical protein